MKPCMKIHGDLEIHYYSIRIDGLGNLSIILKTIENERRRLSTLQLKIFERHRLISILAATYMLQAIGDVRQIGSVYFKAICYCFQKKGQSQRLDTALCPSPCKSRKHHRLFGLHLAVYKYMYIPVIYYTCVFRHRLFSYARLWLEDRFHQASQLCAASLISTKRVYWIKLLHNEAQKIRHVDRRQ